MPDQIVKLFTDLEVKSKIKNKLPKLFQIAEIENQKGGKIGMQVGTTRENIITALLIDTFGESNVDFNIPINKPEVDVRVFEIPYSIKTLSDKGLNGLKLIWSGDSEQATLFRNNYVPSCGIIFTHIQWDKIGGFYYIPLSCQKEIFEEVGRENYIKLLTKGTNNRGVELYSSALKKLLSHQNTWKIEIKWERQPINYQPYTRWIELWQQ